MLTSSCLCTTDVPFATAWQRAYPSSVINNLTRQIARTAALLLAGWLKQPSLHAP
jgi:hypothetical protein